MTEKHVSRRGFLKATAAGVAGIPLTHAEAETGRAPTIHSSKARVPAVLGGAPVRTGRFPSWPQIQEADERIWTQVLQEKAWCELSGGTQVAEFERRFQQRMGGATWWLWPTARVLCMPA